MRAVLVVDDNELLCRLACDILETGGYRAIPTCNATQALEALEKESFDLMVTDQRMPGMSGLELARLIRVKIPGLPIIMMTAYDLIEADGIAACLAKDNLFPGLLEAIDACLNEENEQNPQPCQPACEV